MHGPERNIYAPTYLPLLADDKQPPDDPAILRLYYVAATTIPHAWTGTGGT